MILSETYYQKLLEKFNDVPRLETSFSNNIISLTTKIILEHYKQNKPIHFNFQNSKETIFEIGRHLFVELANDIYLNHYDLPDNYIVGDKLKRIKDNQYYEIIRADNDNFTLRQVLRKTKVEISPAILPEISYDRLAKSFLKIDTGKGISERTIKNYFAFFENLNGEKSDFPKTRFEKKTVFIAKRPFWENINERGKIPSIYLPNPNDGNDINPQKSIDALTDCIAYVTPKYEVCYQNILLKGEKIKTIIVFDTEADKIQQMIQDKARFGFNLIIISNSFSPLKNEEIPCWNWFREEIEIVNAL